MKRSIRAAVLCIAICGPCGAQQKDDGDELVMVPKKYLSPEALSHQASPKMEEASKWVGFGKEVGQAMNEGLSAVVTQADRFGATKVGFFVMAMVAWKVVGPELMNVVLGIPIMIAGVLLWIWSFRHFFYPRRILTRKDGKAKEWTLSKYEFDSKEGRAGCVTIHTCFLGVWLLIWVLKIF